MGRAQDRDAAGRRDGGERRPILAIVIADQVPRALAKGRGLAELLGDPARSQLDHEEGEQRLEEQVGPGRKSQAQIAVAWLWRNVAQDCPRGRGARGLGR